MLDVKMTDVKLADQLFAGHEIAGHKIDGPMCRTWYCYLFTNCCGGVYLCLLIFNHCYRILRWI